MGATSGLHSSRASSSSSSSSHFYPQRRSHRQGWQNRTQAIAADRELGAPRNAVVPMARTRRVAQQLHVRLNEQLWQDRLYNSLPSVPQRVEQEDALSHGGWEPAAHHLSKAELWAVMRQEARAAAEKEPVLASFLHMTVIMHTTLEKSMAFLLANKLASPTLLGTQLTRLFMEAYEDDPDILEACVADVQAVYDRDPACEQYAQCMLYFKGFQAIQCQRVANWMWRKGRRALALALQSRMSEVFAVDIHPAARIGRGILLDHATGVVIGETAVIGDNVSMLHHVTLGGSGTGKGVRHPTVGNGVLLGAGVSVLGPIVIGHCSKVGAGSVVVTDIPPHCVAVGVPATVVKVLDDTVEPVKAMDQCVDFILDYVI
ncbi:hypothetical protein N2152v2_005113 [Parachlorella kessleri]